MSNPQPQPGLPEHEQQAWDAIVAGLRGEIDLGPQFPASEPAQQAELEEDGTEDIAEFDFWLRADGHRRNPGTSADVIASALFVLLRERRLDWPVRFY